LRGWSRQLEGIHFSRFNYIFLIPQKGSSPQLLQLYSHNLLDRLMSHKTLDNLRALTQSLASRDSDNAKYARELELFIIECRDSGCPMVVKALEEGRVILRAEKPDEESGEI